jgi:hypothetical protein
MKTRTIHIGAAFLLLLCLSQARAALLYVNLNSTNPVAPYSNWTTAATSIQAAVDGANPGDEVLVTNGIYQSGGRPAASGDVTNRVAVTTAITIRSVNGPATTLIEGYQVPGAVFGTNAVRCVYLTNGAVIIGFTLTNGASGTGSFTAGGGISCGSTSEVVSNCILTGNSAGTGGGASLGRLYNCLITNNSASQSPGGPHSGCGGGISGGLQYGCTIVSNTSYSEGGGAFGSTMTSCVVAGNGSYFGGGLYQCTAAASYLVANQAVDGGGASYCTLNNCLIASNSAVVEGGGVAIGNVTNCTIAYNSAGFYGGGAAAAQFNPGNFFNCIIYDNTGAGNYGTGMYGVTMNYCCTTPSPGSGLGNITNDPAFIDPINGNFRLQTNSPCINTGNNAYVGSTIDLDGRPRIVGGTVDIGAYEFQAPGLGEFTAWLQQYGLPTDGSGDYADTDGDGMNNQREWICGTNPTDALSVLRMTTTSNGPSGTTVSWLSVTNRSYFVLRGSNIMTLGSFQTVASNLVGQAGSTSYFDPSATGPGPYFYRVGVQ